MNFKKNLMLYLPFKASCFFLADCDVGIGGYSDDSVITVKYNEQLMNQAPLETRHELV